MAEEKTYDEMSPEEQKQYRITRYNELTDFDTAVAKLLREIELARAGALPVWSTGFSALDALLDGGFLSGNLILLGAISSLGKTTFALQIAENLALSGKDVLVFSLEMSESDLLAKSISRNTYKLVESASKASPRLDYYEAGDRLAMGDVKLGRIGDGQADAVNRWTRRDLFDRALAETMRLKDHLRILRDNDMSVDKLEEIVRAHEEATGNKPFVILDYLQILKHDESARGDKRLLTDDDVNRLKDIAVRINIPIMVISSFNRNNYFEPASMGSFKESGTIEYSSDVLIAMQYSGMQYEKHKGNDGKTYYESQADHNNRVRDLLDKCDAIGATGGILDVDVVLLKNRGNAKGTVYFEFCPKYNVFTEKANQAEAGAPRAVIRSSVVSKKPTIGDKPI